MSDSIKTIGVLTSGGDSPGMNAVVRAVVRRGLSKGLNVKGIRRGYLGLINEEIVDMEARSVSNVMQHGGTILETERCFVREFTVEDLDGIYALYDEEARRFLEPPSRDRAHEREILRAYIDRVYGLYGFGHWAVFLKEDPGTLVGRVGYSAITSRQEREAQALNTACPDADFGFLILGDRRGKGIAGEVCRALLRYGFSELGFSCIRADARNDNAASIRLLKKLGFVPVGSCLPEKSGEQGDKTLFILNSK